MHIMIKSIQQLGLVEIIKFNYTFNYIKNSFLLITFITYYLYKQIYIY